ncbi:uncharacterized protein LOC126978908 [Leptidea sinapis]|uniref:uncharacterized protein LOC126978908 n=1 Tax=Leptidea sinapis TaxID=189913 RepID=UPI0021C2B65B|nr:uncharacterized protein LOC126978908 [Leptidea sinapis]
MSRRNETTDEREQRLTLLRENYHQSRNNQTEEQLNDSKETDRIRKRLQRKRKTNEQADDRRIQNAIRMRDLRLNEQMEAQVSKTTVYSVRQKRREKYSLEQEAFHYNPTRNYFEHSSIVIGRMNEVCKFCEAKKFKGETQSICCSSGKIKLPELKSLPPEFLEYKKGETQNSKEFLQQIRNYNACFQMTSFGATAVIEEKGFNPVFKIQGQVYHKIGSLLSLPNNTPKFLQIYFVGNEEDELDQRLSNFIELRRDIILHLQRFLHENNELIKIFKTAMEKMVSDSYKIIIRADKKPIGEHERRFNAPQVNEIAVVMVGNESSYRDIVVQRRSNKLERIAETHHMYDALQYPLIFCHGEDGYHFNIQHVDPQTNSFFQGILRISDNGESE